MNAYAAVGACLLTGMLSTQALAERKYSDWSAAVSLTAAGDCNGINSTASDTGAAISKDGLSLYFGSARPGGVGNSDLYVVQRTSPDAAWGVPANLGTVVNSSAIDNVPSLSRDGHWLFFNSSRPDGFGGVDIWVSYRAHVHDDFAWEEPRNLGPGVNSALFDAGASYFENEDGSAPQLYFNRGLATGVGNDIMVSELQADGTFGPATVVPGINSTTASDQRASIRYDGLEMFFYSNRDGTNDIWVTTRNSVNDAWSTPVKLGEQINTASTNEITPHISPDGLTLFFSSDRPGGCGGNDLYMSTRTRLKGKDKE